MSQEGKSKSSILLFFFFPGQMSPEIHGQRNQLPVMEDLKKFAREHTITNINQLPVIFSLPDSTGSGSIGSKDKVDHGNSPAKEDREEA